MYNINIKVQYYELTAAATLIKSYSTENLKIFVLLHLIKREGKHCKVLLNIDLLLKNIFNFNIKLHWQSVFEKAKSF